VAHATRFVSQNRYSWRRHSGHYCDDHCSPCSAESAALPKVDFESILSTDSSSRSLDRFDRSTTWVDSVDRLDFCAYQLGQLSLASLRGHLIEYQLRLGKGGNVTSAGWQETLCDHMWHVSSRSSVATLRTAIHLLLTYLSIDSIDRFQGLSRMGPITALTANLNFKNPRWRTAAILKTVKSPYLCNYLTNFDEIWWSILGP